MFDENPFRDYKNWLRQRKLEETTQGKEETTQGEIESLIPHSPDDLPAKTTGGNRYQYFKGGQDPQGIEADPIGDSIHGMHGENASLKHLELISDPSIAAKLTGNHISMLLDQIEEERRDARVEHGSPFSPHHQKIIDIIHDHPNKTAEHHQQILKMQEKYDPWYKPGEFDHFPR